MLAGHLPEARQNDDSELLSLAASVANRRGDLTEYEGAPRWFGFFLTGALVLVRQADPMITELLAAETDNPVYRRYLAMAQKLVSADSPTMPRRA